MGLIAYKCPNCGGEMRFDPSTQQYKCDYCFSLFSQEALDGMQEAQQPSEKGAGGGDSSEGSQEEGTLYTCPSCGAQIVTDETTTATYCYYCHTPVVLAGKLEGSYHPDSIIPFSVDRKKAVEIFDGWVSKKKYIPPDFYTKEQIDKMTGVYFPYWLYGCRVEGTLGAEASKLNVWTAGNIRYTRTEKYDISREGDMKVANVMRNALSKANHKLVEGVLPFEVEKMQPFNMDYLAGFMAENRDMGQEQFGDQIKAEVTDFAAASLREGISGYDSVNIRSQDIKIRDADWKYALLPVWTLTYKDPRSEKIYYFACNGQTGKVCGELPTDPGRLRTLFFRISLPLLAVLLLIGYFL